MLQAEVVTKSIPPLSNSLVQPVIESRLRMIQVMYAGKESESDTSQVMNQEL